MTRPGCLAQMVEIDHSVRQPAARSSRRPARRFTGPGTGLVRRLG